MSKVGANASSAELIAQIKDQYQSRERDSETHHRDEIKEIREAHKVEIDELKAETQKRVQTIEEESSVKLSQKDLQNQREIDALKAIYAKRVSEGRKPTV